MKVIECAREDIVEDLELKVPGKCENSSEFGLGIVG